MCRRTSVQVCSIQSIALGFASSLISVRYDASGLPSDPLTSHIAVICQTLSYMLPPFIAASRPWLDAFAHKTRILKQAIAEAYLGLDGCLRDLVPQLASKRLKTSMRRYRRSVNEAQIVGWPHTFGTTIGAVLSQPRLE
ncbi:hypothetical protein DAEQUDRAFT_389477 [Daedalea quercina L-15889]|uniref:Uncharacterized protein n=1 Tax=Daedalea quercina L-15889 TaxID=1314783 RepID=A0A165NZI0_9APHY|nr:hypothetical protein DAEQUDRAFT_389477 [Daedalea quercina L-15889]